MYQWGLVEAAVQMRLRGMANDGLLPEMAERILSHFRMMAE
jgi:hypothetical protein